ncbi:glycosyltransferase family 2 protein [Octadecabacter sp. G9-8]|uniref:Glycosyltransferase family 2 protein n=1 Tax=Octadecabacter dasysiphoniae TaxID=2909341 RepID=A0ABS9CTK0_9RHOB|nr:glycosyltransferase family A protein [Octadecabacter dasysiphoniae]MCF2870422.1 glycosyltransferase family 2 protein [Octadecabacter dasysiphoniae]
MDITGLGGTVRTKVAMMSKTQPLVHVRTTAYKRPDALRRGLQSLQAQTWSNWICDVYDDCPDGSARAVITELDDPRIRFHHNKPQLFASKNIDQCFSRNNPHDAAYFFVLEDDNFVLPTFISDNIALCKRHGVHMLFRNQLVELDSGTDRARISTIGVLDDKLTGGLYSADVFRLCLMADIGVSNGGLFWSRDAATDLEIHYDCSATLQEYMRTFAICEPIYVAMEPLAVWAENGEETMRDFGNTAGYFKRELSLKRSVGVLQRNAWALAEADDREAFLTHPVFRYPERQRATGLVKSHTQFRVGRSLEIAAIAKLAFRGAVIRLIGKVEPAVLPFIQARKG